MLSAAPGRRAFRNGRDEMLTYGTSKVNLSAGTEGGGRVNWKPGPWPGFPERSETQFIALLEPAGRRAGGALPVALCTCLSGPRDPHIVSNYAPVDDPSITAPIIEISSGRKRKMSASRRVSLAIFSLSVWSLNGNKHAGRNHGTAYPGGAGDMSLSTRGGALRPAHMVVGVNVTGISRVPAKAACGR